MAKTVSGCVYDNERHPQSTGTYPPHGADGHLFEIPTAKLPHLLGDGMFLPTKLDQIPPTPSDVVREVTNEPDALRVFGDGQVLQGELVLARKNSLEQRAPLDASLSSIAVPFFSLPAIPRKPWISLSFLGEEKLQVQISETAATDLAMKSCV